MNQNVEIEKLKLNKNMHRYDMLWEKDNSKLEDGFRESYVDRTDYMHQEMDSLLHYKIVSVDEDTGRLIWNDHRFYLCGYAELYGLCDEYKIMYYIFDRLYIEDPNGKYTEMYLQHLDYYNSLM